MLLPLLLALASVLPAGGCASDQRRSTALPDPVERSTLGPGDVFELIIIGEKDLPTEFQVASDGTVNLPYIHRVEVAGLERHEVEEQVRRKLIEEQILTDPSVVVKVKVYASKRVAVLGQVRQPGSFPLEPGMTLITALSQAGGMTSIAYESGVILSRAGKNGRTTTVVIDVSAINDGRAPDVPLQAGDRIYVRERVF